MNVFKKLTRRIALKNDLVKNGSTKKVAGVFGARPTHWVGDGFLVQSLMHYDDPNRSCDPFLLLDYAAPMKFEPHSGQPRGVGEHPHKGFETVTIAYKGEVAHRDSSGGGGVIKEGDVQWMTAGGGIVHEEFHSEEFSRQGGEFEMVQLWVNLPAKDKETPAAYQPIVSEQIPVISLPGDAGSLRLIAGQYGEQKGAAKTFTEINLWDLCVKAGATANMEIAQNHNTMMVILDGEVLLNNESSAKKGELVKFEREGSSFSIEAVGSEAKILLLSGVPIDEPIAGYGPFVMNTREEIVQAFSDYEAGKFGGLH